MVHFGGGKGVIRGVFDVVDHKSETDSEKIGGQDGRKLPGEMALGGGDAQDRGDDHKPGILIEMDSPGETAQAILKILRDESLKFKMGRAARECALVKYSWERAVQETAILVRSLLK